LHEFSMRIHSVFPEGPMLRAGPQKQKRPSPETEPKGLYERPGERLYYFTALFLDRCASASALDSKRPDNGV